jgi:hypothetical protein
MPVIIYEDKQTNVAAAEEGGRLWLAANDLTLATGWEIKPEGICRDEVCIPIPHGDAGSWVREEDGRESLDLAGFARYVEQPYVRDERHSVWSFGPSADEQRDKLLSLEAPDFTLPDLIDGRSHSLSEFRGKKVLLALWASW